MRASLGLTSTLTNVRLSGHDARVTAAAAAAEDACFEAPLRAWLRGMAASGAVLRLKGVLRLRGAGVAKAAAVEAAGGAVEAAAGAVEAAAGAVEAAEANATEAAEAAEAAAAEAAAGAEAAGAAGAARGLRRARRGEERWLLVDGVETELS